MQPRSRHGMWFSFKQNVVVLQGADLGDERPLSEGGVCGRKGSSATDILDKHDLSDWHFVIDIAANKQR